MVSRDSVKDAFKLAWSGFLLLAATAILTGAFSAYAVYFFLPALRSSMQTESIIAPLAEPSIRLACLVGIGLWIASLGNRGILDAGRVPRDDGE